VAFDFDSLAGVEVARSDEPREQSDLMRCCAGSASSGGAVGVPGKQTGPLGACGAF
jgi:hypothetical protein